MEILSAYVITFGWALVGSISMGLGLAVMLFVFTHLTPQVDEWKLIREGSIPMAMIMAAVIIACGIVVASAIRP